jgi:hypothetical protein
MAVRGSPSILSEFLPHTGVPAGSDREPSVRTRGQMVTSRM